MDALWEKFAREVDQAIDYSQYRTIYFEYCLSYAKELKDEEKLNEAAFLKLFPDPALELEVFLEFHVKEYVAKNFCGTLTEWFETIGSAADKLLWKCFLHQLFIYQPESTTRAFLKRERFDNLYLLQEPKEEDNSDDD